MTMIKPPLPFAGHKGCWNDELTQLFETLPSGATVVDVFGGSGVCSHIAKKCRPDLRVVYNDFDNYAARLSHVSETEQLRLRLLDILGKKSKGAYTKLTEEQNARVNDELHLHREKFGFLDDISVTRWLYLFPMNRDRCEKNQMMLNRVTVTPCDVQKCEHWFDGIERVRFDVTKTDLLSEFPGAVFIFDPPFMATNCDDYDKKETLNVLGCCVPVIRKSKFMLFGDPSAVFCYDLICEHTPHKKSEKKLGSLFGMKRRVEMLYTNFGL